MKIKFLVEEDFINYYKPSMFIGFPKCTWKCETDCNMKGICQNSSLANTPTYDIDPQEIVNRFKDNPISKSIVFGGLEPFDSWRDVVILIHKFRQVTDADIVIYTGYYEPEISDNIEYLRQNYDNIIVKFGRFIFNDTKKFDDVLKVTLASNNQYAERIC